MDDLISRQALCEYALNQKDKSVTPNDIIRFPSAQPEIIYCMDCKHCNRLDHEVFTEYGFTNIETEFYCDKLVDSEEDDLIAVMLDDYCSWAERRTDEAD